MMTTADRPRVQTSGLLAQLADGVRALKESEAWTAYLDTQARFHRYSFGNTMLIASQRPDATQVAGFGKWLTLGRHVRKGEHGIAILAPMAHKVSGETPDDDRVIVSGFRAVFVFDVAQTDGDELPPVPCVRLDGDGCALDLLTAHAQALGFTVITDNAPNGANGYTDPIKRVIALRDDLSGAQQTKTLAHEIGHATLHATECALTRDERELEAESVAYVVTTALGIEADGYSFGYLASWGADDKAIRFHAGRIQKTASAILTACGIESM